MQLVTTPTTNKRAGPPPYLGLDLLPWQTAQALQILAHVLLRAFCADQPWLANDTKASEIQLAPPAHYVPPLLLVVNVVEVDKLALQLAACVAGGSRCALRRALRRACVVSRQPWRVLEEVLDCRP